MKSINRLRLATVYGNAYKADLGKADYKYFYEGYNYMGVAVSNAISDKYGPKDSLDRAVKSFSNWIIDNGF